MYTLPRVYICTCVCTLVYTRHRARGCLEVGADAPTAVKYYSGFFVALPVRIALFCSALHPLQGYCIPSASLCVSLAVLAAPPTVCGHPVRSAVLTAPPAPTGVPRHHPRRARSQLHSPEAPRSVPPPGGPARAASGGSSCTRPRFSRPSFIAPRVMLLLWASAVRAPFAAGSVCTRPAPALALAVRQQPPPAAPPARPALLKWMFPNQFHDDDAKPMPRLPRGGRTKTLNKS